MKAKTIVESILAAVISAVFSYRALISPATLAALAIRHRMPDAWFSDLIEWYAEISVMGVSIVIAAVAGRVVYRSAVSTNPTSRL